MIPKGRILRPEKGNQQQVASFRPDDALKRIEEEVARANSKIESDRQRATTEVQAVFDKANQEGYRAGYERGLQQGLTEQEAAYRSRLQEEIDKRTESITRTIEAAANEITRLPAEWIREWEPQAMDLIVSIASRVARKVVSSDDETVVRTLREILSMVARAPAIVVYLHPADMETVKLRSVDLQAVVGRSANIRFEAQSDLDRGGCRVETDHCQIDASVETQIARLLDEIVAAGTPSLR
jgi:flagellar assembly protein FliH